MSSFDEQLALSSPPVPARSPELDAELARVIVRAEGLALRRRRLRGRNATIAGAVVLGALGAGGAATAGGLLPWYDSAPSHGVVTTSTGTRCNVTFGIKQHVDPAAPITEDLRARVTTTAEKYLESFDFSTLDALDATTSLASRPAVDSGVSPAVSVADYEMDAVYQEVARRINAELAARHLPISSVSLAMASDCNGDDQ